MFNTTPAHLVLIWPVAKMCDQHLHAFGWVTSPVGPGVRAQGFVSIEQQSIETCPLRAQLHSLLWTSILRLIYLQQVISLATSGWKIRCFRCTQSSTHTPIHPSYKWFISAESLCKYSQAFHIYIPLQKDLVSSSVGKAGPSDSEVFHQPQVFHLVSHQNVVKTPCRNTELIRWRHRELMCEQCFKGTTRDSVKQAFWRYTPGCLASLGFRQRTYHGSLDMRISVRPIKLLLNWVATYKSIRKGEILSKKTPFKV